MWIKVFEENGTEWIINTEKISAVVPKKNIIVIDGHSYMLTKESCVTVMRALKIL